MSLHQPLSQEGYTLFVKTGQPMMDFSESVRVMCTIFFVVRDDLFKL